MVLVPQLRDMDGHNVAGVVIDSNRFLGRVRAAQLFQLAVDPRRTEDLREVEKDRQLQSVRQIRVEVQRLFEGAKAKNVEPYAQYIAEVHDGADGMAPPIILYSESEFEVYEDAQTGAGKIQIPFDAQLVAIDGETQLAARFEARSIREETSKDFVPILICYGKPIQWARQVFHDLNLLAVKPNAALGLSMDERDPLTQVAREIADSIPLFKGRVNFKRRQLGSRDKEIITFAALRVACVTLAEGITGVKYGAKPVQIDLDRIPAIRIAAVKWFSALGEVVGPAMEDRSRTLASSSSVMAALGAMGHQLVATSDDRRCDEITNRLIAQLKSVQWEKGPLWDGIAGKYGVKGRFSTSGAKDAAYLIYAALTDQSSEGYRQIRDVSLVSAGFAGREEASSEEQTPQLAGSL